MHDETTTKAKQVPTALLSDEVAAAPRVARWWRRPVAATSRTSKAVCMLAAAFALTAVLGVTPSRVVAEELDHGEAIQEEAQREPLPSEESYQQASEQDDSDNRNATQVAATVPDPTEPHMQPTTDSSTSLSLAAAYVSEEQDESADGSGNDDTTSEDAANELNGEVLTSTSNGAAIQVGDGESLAARGSTIISLATTGSSALNVSDGGAADVAAVSTLSARGEGSIALACVGTGSVARLSDSSAYASGERCAAISAADGATVSVERGSLEATLGTVVRAEGSGSSVSLANVQILSTGSLAELCGDAALSLDGVTSASSHAATIYVAAGVPSLRLTNGSVVRGTIVIADGADIDIQTDATSRIDGRIVHLSAASVA